MQIKVEHLTTEDIEKRGVGSWPIWEKERSSFDWQYDQTEECLILEGRVRIEADEGELEIKPGDFVTFPKGLSCVWHVLEPVKKHYNFL